MGIVVSCVSSGVSVVSALRCAGSRQADPAMLLPDSECAIRLACVPACCLSLRACGRARSVWPG